MLAKAGDTFSKKARDKLVSFERMIDLDAPVHPRADGQRGQWICIDCGDLPRNNWDASSHPKKHRLAWRNFVSGNVEVAE